MTMATTMCSVALDAVRGQRNRNFYIQLAKESPSHNSELSDNDDDDLAYDSVHGKETGNLKCLKDPPFLLKAALRVCVRA